MKDIVEQAINYAQPIGLIGRQGVGKSTVVKQVVREQHLPFLEVALERTEVEDVFGLPTVVDGRLVRLKTALVDFLEQENKGVVFFDEALSASPQVLQTIQTMISERYLPEFKLSISKEIVFIIASNDDKVGTFVTKPSQAFSDRFAWYAVEADFDYFKEAYGEGYADLLQKHYDQSDDVKDFVASMIDLSPRSYERGIQLFQAGASVDFVSGLLPRLVAKRLYDEVNGLADLKAGNHKGKAMADYGVYDWFSLFESKFIDGKGGKPSMDKIRGHLAAQDKLILEEAIEAMDMVLVIKDTQKARAFRGLLEGWHNTLVRPKNQGTILGSVAW
jgi:hypothetical protein